ncbi:MAG: cobalamin-dependent protein [Pseudomonadota bacterium]
MADSGQSFKAVRESGAYRAGALTFRKLGERLKRGGKTKEPSNDLVRVIETEVLPRLMLIHKQDLDSSFDDCMIDDYLSESQIDRFIYTIIEDGTQSAGDLILQLIADGLSVEDVLMNLLAPAARRMGEKWSTDEFTFVDVTIGLCRLHELLRETSVIGDIRYQTPTSDQPSILLSTVCCDQHTLGIQIVAEFFRRDGWKVSCEPGASIAELVQLVQKHTFDFVALSAAKPVDLQEVAVEIKNVREASANQNIKIIIGGASLPDIENIADSVGADMVSLDAASAPRMARAFLTTSAMGI